MKTSWLWMCSCVLTATAAVAAPLRVIYPRQAENDSRDTYKIELLERVLQATTNEFGGFVLEPSAAVMTENRMDALMTRGDGRTLNVIFKPSTRDREESMIPVRIPILKGLLGYRVCLIHEDTQPVCSRVQTLEDLKALTVGQGLGWRDTEVFERNGIHVETSPDYEGLFAMLNGKRFDLFSRGITEIPAEFAERKERFPAMRIETDLLLYYPWPVYFFTIRNDEGRQLADRIGRGLDRLRASGEFDELFDRYHKGTMEELHLKDRRVIRLENPILPAETPLDRKELWLTLDELE